MTASFYVRVSYDISDVRLVNESFFWVGSFQGFIWADAHKQSERFVYELDAEC